MLKQQCINADVFYDRILITRCGF